MFDNLRVDLQQACKVNLGKKSRFKMLQILVKPGTFPVVSYRLAAWARTVRIPVVRQILILIAEIARYFTGIISGVIISPAAKIGPGFVIHTWHGVFVGPVKIGKNCVMQHGVVIGWNTREIGDNVFFGPGAKVMGAPKIGNNVVVIANSLVMTDVPDDSTIVGVPARIRLPRGSSLQYRPNDPEKKPEEQAKTPAVPESIVKS